jgi:hypothetical protein
MIVNMVFGFNKYSQVSDLHAALLKTEEVDFSWEGNNSDIIQFYIFSDAPNT